MYAIDDAGADMDKNYNENDDADIYADANYDCISKFFMFFVKFYFIYLLFVSGLSLVAPQTQSFPHANSAGRNLPTVALQEQWLSKKFTQIFTKVCLFF